MTRCVVTPYTLELLLTPPQIVCHSTTTFIAHLVNQTVAHEIIALQILVLLLERPTDDSIEIAVGFTREVGAYLAENSPKANATVFERFRAVLNEGAISHRVQYMIEVLMQVRKDRYKDNPILAEGLDLVEEDDQITHQVQLEEELQVQEGLSKYRELCLGSTTLTVVQIFSSSTRIIWRTRKNTSLSRRRYWVKTRMRMGTRKTLMRMMTRTRKVRVQHSMIIYIILLNFSLVVVESKQGIEDRTETNLVNLRRVIYLTIMNALNYEEAVHKLLKVQIDEGQEVRFPSRL